MKQKICPICGKEFECNTARKYCSIICAKRAETEKIKQAQRGYREARTGWVEVTSCYPNGVKSYQFRIFNGAYCANGCFYRSWYSNGNPMEERTYENGYKHVLRWRMNGDLYEDSYQHTAMLKENETQIHSLA